MRLIRPIRLILLGSLLMAGCAEEEMGVWPVSGDAVPIAFECWTDETYKSDETRTANGYTGNLTNENQQLRYAGFGVFMAHNASSKPDIMYNQRVEYTFLSDGSGNGYWTYSPLKYWPAQANGVSICAYAPYVENPVSVSAGTTGIIGLSDNDDTTPLIFFARAKHPEENVDLLWSHVGVTDAMLTDGRPRMSRAVGLQMKHALTRVKLSIGITNGSTLATGDKLLVKRVTLTGNFAKTGKLDLTGSGTTPTWTEQDVEATDETIFVDCNPEVNPNSYGIIAEEARYIEGLPYNWLPSGLPHTNYNAADATTKTNLLCMGDAPSYLYLIPQTALEFTCVVDFYRKPSVGDATEFSKSTDSAIQIASLEGNKTYDLTLKITL